MTISFQVPFVVSQPDSWGPPDYSQVDEANPNAPPSSGKFVDLPYSPFGRSDRLGRAADFTNASRGDRSRFNRQYDRDRRQGDRYNNRNRRDEDKDDEDEDGDEVFQLVDTSKASTTKRFVTPAARRRQHTARLRQVNARRQQQVGSTPALSKEVLRGGGRGGGSGGRGVPGGRGGPGRGGRGGRGGHMRDRVDRQPSVAVQNDWTKVEELDLAKITKNLSASTVVPTAEDVLWCGFLDHYNDAYDKVTARQPQPLKRIDTKEFYPVSTTDDPVLEKLAIDGVGKGIHKVFVTDTILAHLMTCTRSVQPWDLVIEKTGGILFLDKRDNSQLDYLTVWETAYNPPNPSDDGINNPERLGLEATTINQNFSQQILRSAGAGRKYMELPNPFFDEEDNDGMEPASVAFRYRKFELDDKTTLVCRTELHGLVKKTQYMTAFALNEFIPPQQSSSAQSQTWYVVRFVFRSFDCKCCFFLTLVLPCRTLQARQDRFPAGCCVSQ
jgi:translation initiation factor 3 subunit D